MRLFAEDLNGDSRKDLVTPQGVGFNLADGGWSFSNLGYERFSPLAVVDILGDGRPQVIIAQSYSQTIQVLRAAADGGIESALTLPCRFQAVALGVGDLNGDGQKDVVCAGPSGTPGVSAILLTDAGTLEFSLQPKSALSVRVGDIDGDGRAEIVAANASSSGYATELSVLGITDAGLVELSTYALPAGLRGFEAADLTGDGGLEVLGTTCATEPCALKVLKGSSGGTLVEASSPTTMYYVGGVAVTDFDNDGDKDLILSGAIRRTDGGVFSANSAHLSLLANDGAGDLSEVQRLETGVDPPFVNALVSLDLTGDGLNELVMSSVNNPFPNPIPFLGVAPGRFLSPRAYELPVRPSLLAVGDLNNDRRPDIAFSDGYLLGVVLNSDGPSFNQPRTLKTGSFAQLLVADVDGDGSNDLLALGKNTGSLTLLLARNGDFAQSEVALPGAAGVWIADLDSDGAMDLLSLKANGEVSLSRGTGAGTFNPPVAVEGASGVADIALLDLNGDHRRDFAALLKTGGVAVFVQGTRRLEPSVMFGSSLIYWPQVAAGDFDGDGDEDLLVVGADANAELLINANGALTSRPLPTLPRNPSRIRVADFDGDGDLDAILWSPNADYLLMRNDGAGAFDISRFHGQTRAYESIAVADFDQDGRPDVVAPDPYYYPLLRLYPNGCAP